jgi:ABC-type transport system involved in cytochrome bd biosynthesis fused ATPase/permease subunit
MATLMTLVNVVFFIYYTDYQLLPSYVVYAIGFYQRLCHSIGFMFSRAFIQLSNALVSINRVNEFLLSKELVDHREAPKGNNTAVQMENFNFSWKKDNEFAIENVSFQVSNGELAAIVGPVGSGKVIYFDLKV